MAPARILRQTQHRPYIPPGDSLRGPALGAYALVQASDGYRVVFALAEFDRGFSDRVTLVADQKDGKPLAAAEVIFSSQSPRE